MQFTCYNNPLFKEILEEVYDIKQISIFETEEINNLCPFFISNKVFKKNLIFNMPFNFYYTPNFKTYENKFLDDIYKFSIQNNVNIKIKSFARYKKLNSKIYARNPILELLDSYEYMFSNFSKNLQKNIKRNINNANNDNISIYKTDDKEKLKEFYSSVLAEQYIKEHKMIFQPYRLFEKLIDSKIAHFFIAEKNNSVLGGIILIDDGEVLHYNWSARKNYKNIAIGTLLINKTIEFAIDNNYKYYDFGSTPISDDNLYNFKMRWGCKNYDIYESYSLFEPKEIDLNKDFSFFRNIYAKMPKPFIEYIIPKVVPWLVS